MVTVYKLTDSEGFTRKGLSGEIKWMSGIEHTAPGRGVLCTSDYIHAYANPNLAVLMNPVHANIYDPLMWEAKGEVEKTDGLKLGCTRLTVLKKIELPHPTLNQKIAFGILSALCVYRDKNFLDWARSWLNGIGRTRSFTGVTAAARANDAAARAVNSDICIMFCALADYVMSCEDLWSPDVSRFVGSLP